MTGLAPAGAQDRWAGLLLGTALGDALGLPLENLSPRRAGRLFPGPVRPRLVFGRAMVSDDTDHTVFVLQSLLEEPADPEAFTSRLAWRFRFWLASLPAGVGFATLRAILKLWLGFSPGNAGVRSAGNGPAMRVAAIGAWFADRPLERRRFVEAATRITHSDPRALTGALLVAEVAAWIVTADLHGKPPTDGFLDLLRSVGPGDDPWPVCLDALTAAVTGDEPVCRLAERLGCGERGVSGFICHTVPVALYAWFRNAGDFAASLTDVLGCGGDTDTTGAITGALAGLTVGRAGLPGAWIEGLWDWPHGRDFLDRLAARAAAGNEERFPLWHPGLPLRNLLFLTLVLGHGFRRLLPPY